MTTADLQRVAQKYLRDDRLNVTSLNPIGSLTAPGAVETNAVKSEVEKFVLPNGLRLLVREDPRLPLVSIYAGFRGGLLAENLENNGITRLLSRTLLKGTKNRTAVQIAEQIESAGGRIGSDNGNNSFSVSVEVMKPDLALGLEVLADVLENPTFPKKRSNWKRRLKLLPSRQRTNKSPQWHEMFSARNSLTTIPTHCARAGASKPSKSSRPRS